jgi:hypothetical protein
MLNEQGRMFVAMNSHMRDKGKTNTLSPLLFPRHSTTMLSGGFYHTMKKTAYFQVHAKVIHLLVFVPAMEAF